jgi:hypothetical protein
MVDAWPAGLPQRLLVANASKGAGDALLEYQPDTGPSITRRRSSATMRPLIGSVILSSAQIAIWETFFYTTILSGSLPFDFPDPITGATLLVKHIKQTPPIWSPLGGDNYQLDMSLMVLP